MGIYDREYYRQDRPSFFGAFSGRGAVCKWLIIANAVVFLVQMMTRQSIGPLLTLGPITDALILDVPSVLHGQVWRLLTYAFLHSPDSLWHIVLNMWFLWMFGPDLEEIYGPREFLAFYLSACIFAGVGYVVFHLLGVPGARALGASGATTAVLLLCALHYPTRTILLFFIIPVPIWVCILIVLLPDAYSFLMALRYQQDTGGIGVTGHLAGALFGFLYYKRQWRMLNLLPDLRSLQRRRSRPRLRVYREELADAPVAARAATRSDVDEHLEAKVDAVLEKVAKFGQGSLSDQEKEILLRASEVYRKRRT